MWFVCVGDTNVQGGCDKVTWLRNAHMITPTYYACIVYGRMRGT